MSLKLTRQVWKMPLPTTEKFVLLALADHANDEGVCWPSQGALADATGCSKRTIIKAVKTLQESGLIEVKKSGQNQNQYRLSVVQILHDADSSLVKQVHHSSADSAPPVVQEIHYSSAGDSLPYIDRTTKEPPLEPPKNHHSLCSSGDEPHEKAADAKDKKPKRKSEKKKPVYSPEVLILGERLAVCRTKDAGMKRTTPEAIEYYAGLVDTILKRGEVDQADMELVVGWLETPEGMKSFSYGLGNTPKGYTHALIRNLPQYLRQARGESPQPQFHNGFVRSGSHAPVRDEGAEYDILSNSNREDWQ